MTHDTNPDIDRPADPSRRLALGGALGTTAAAMIGARAANPQPAPDGELTGKTAFITGGARGIGLASGRRRPMPSSVPHSTRGSPSSTPPTSTPKAAAKRSSARRSATSKSPAMTW